MPESFPRLENPENNLDKEALKQKIAANFDDIKKTVYDMDQEKKNA
ncbi:MAG: hypothetical protein Q8O99_05305 [bacterium]|nr:hypothetical protein [bacterium]